MTMGKRIQAARNKLGLSQAELAKLIGVTKSAVGQWEADETAPSRRHSPAVARALQIPPAAIDPRHSSGLVSVPLDNSLAHRQICVMSWDKVSRLERGAPLGGGFERIVNDHR